MPMSKTRRPPPGKGGKPQALPAGAWAVYPMGAAAALLVLAHTGILDAARQRAGWYRQFGRVTIPGYTGSNAVEAVAPQPSAVARCPAPGARALPRFSAGTNLIDVPDDEDGDMANDGLRGYGSQEARDTMARIKAQGQGVAVLPVRLAIAGCSSTDVRPGVLLGTPLGRYRLGRMIDDAHDAGLAVALVPHLFVDPDGTRGGECWHGALMPRAPGRSAEASLALFFQSFTANVAALASLAEEHCAEAMSVGRELKSLTTGVAAPHNASLPLWRSAVAAVRQSFSGQLTYSANWDELPATDPAFWQLLDATALNAFYPLAAHPDSTAEQMRAEAAFVAEQARALSACSGQRPLFWLELGFRSMRGCVMHPWIWPGELGGTDAAKSEDTRNFWEVSAAEVEQDAAGRYVVDEVAQEEAYAAALGALEASPAVQTVAFWAVPTAMYDDVVGTRWYDLSLFTTLYRYNHAQFEPRNGFSYIGKAAEAVISAFAQQYRALAADKHGREHAVSAGLSASGHEQQQGRRSAPHHAGHPRAPAPAALGSSFGSCVAAELGCSVESFGDWSPCRETAGPGEPWGCKGWGWHERRRRCECGSTKLDTSRRWDAWMCKTVQDPTLEAAQGESCKYDVAAAQECKGTQ